MQVHDVAGFMQDDSGTIWPRRRSILTCVAPVLQTGMVLTIEPGIYFIEFCWRRGVKGSSANTSTGRKLKPKPFGGIRIEDNVVVHENNIENMTRDLKLA
ncbi:M24 family metallopeptidase [Shigella flexneri]